MIKGFEPLRRLQKRARFVTVTKLLPEAEPLRVSVGTVVAMAGLSPIGDTDFDAQAPVLGACLAEGPSGTSAVEQSWLVATDGQHFTMSTDPQLRTFVRDAAARAAAGIVIRLGTVWAEVPGAIVDEAAHARLPLLTLPGETTVSAFLRQVHETTGINDVAVLGTALSVQTELIGALSAPDVEGELIRRVSNSLGVSAMLFDSRGAVVAVQGDAPVHLIADHVQLPLGSDLRTTIGRWQVSITPITAGPDQFALAMAWQQGRGIDPELTRSTRFAVQQLLRAHSRTVASARLQDQVQRGQVLGELLEGVTDARLLRMRDGLVLLHFPREGTFQVHLMAADTPVAVAINDPDPVLSLVQEVAAELHVPALMGQHGGNYAVLHAASDAFTDGLLTRIADRSHGASSAFHDLTSTPSALRQAFTSLSASKRNSAFTAFHRVGFIDFILGHLPEETLQERAVDVLGGLQENEVVMETLIEYLRSGLDFQATGRRMHLHANSIRYRLSRAEDYLGRSISDPETITLLYLALHDRLSSPAGATEGA